jgi:hypothetical protein
LIALIGILGLWVKKVVVCLFVVVTTIQLVTNAVITTAPVNDTHTLQSFASRFTGGNSPSTVEDEEDDEDDDEAVDGVDDRDVGGRDEEDEESTGRVVINNDSY